MRDRQYLFRRRLDRRWVAKRLAMGVPVVEIAAIERASEWGVRLLLRSPSFRSLAGGWRAVAAMDRAARLERLTAMALDVLELALAHGCRKAAFFVIGSARSCRRP
jgi:hypothetical protein